MAGRWEPRGFLLASHQAPFTKPETGKDSAPLGMEALAFHREQETQSTGRDVVRGQPAWLSAPESGSLMPGLGPEDSGSNFPPPEDSS